MGTADGFRRSLEFSVSVSAPRSHITDIGDESTAPPGGDLAVNGLRLLGCWGKLVIGDFKSLTAKNGLTILISRRMGGESSDLERV